MSKWTHSQCEACWIAAEMAVTHEGTIIRRPHLLKDPEAECCCYCGKFTIVGIYRRDDPALVQHCLGNHDDL